MALFEVLSEKFKPKHNETILPLQFCKLIRQQNKNADEGMGHLRIKANELKNKQEKDRRPNDQFINSISQHDMTGESI